MPSQAEVQRWGLRKFICSAAAWARESVSVSASFQGLQKAPINSGHFPSSTVNMRRGSLNPSLQTQLCAERDFPIWVEMMSRPSGFKYQTGDPVYSCFLRLTRVGLLICGMTVALDVDWGLIRIQDRSFLYFRELRALV